MTNLSDGHGVAALLSAAALLPLLLCVVFRRPARTVRGYFTTAEGKRIALFSENVVGSGRGCDIKLKSVNAKHYGFIKISDSGEMLLASDNGPFAVNGRVKEGAFRPKSGDKIRAEKDVFTFEPPKPQKLAGRGVGWLFCFVSLSVVTVMTVYSCAVFIRNDLPPLEVLAAHGTVFAAIAIYLLFCLFFKRRLQPSVCAALLLSVLSLSVTYAYTPGSVFVQALCVLIGLAGHLAFAFLLRYDKAIPWLRGGAIVLALVLLALNLLSASSLLGARNWLNFGGINFQPSELVKLALVMCGAASVKASVSRGDTLMYMGFSALCVLCMAAISDFGTAMVFFFAFLAMLWMRSGLRDVVLSLLAAIAGCGLIAIVKKDTVAYAVSRVLNWGSAWDNVLSSGYQQTRAMMAAASGGLFGVGLGKGWLGDIFAAGSDMPFAVLWEEAGLLCASAAVFAVALIVSDAVKSAAHCSRSFPAVAACGAASVFVAQLILNVCGTMDMLPFTGVTFPFLSTGGTSMVACWLLLAFVTHASEVSAPDNGGGGMGAKI